MYKMYIDLKNVDIILKCTFILQLKKKKKKKKKTYVNNSFGHT